MGEEASPAVNMMVLHCCRVQERMQGDLGEEGPLGGTMAGVWGMSRVDRTVEMRMVSEFFLRRVLSTRITSVSEQTSADIDGEGA